MNHLRHLVKLFTTTLTASLLLTHAATASDSKASPGVEKLLQDTRGRAQVRVDSQTGNARFVRLPARSLPRSPASNASLGAQGRAQAFFRTYGSAFGVSDADSELTAAGTRRDGMGSEHAILSQTHQSVPVFGGELRAHFDRNGQMIAANGLFVANLKLNMTPLLTAAAAEDIAISRVGNGIDGIYRQATRNREQLYVEGVVLSTDLSASSTTLMVFREGLLKGAPGADHLVYEVEVGNGSDVREFVYVDAHDGAVVDQITGIHDAKFRRAFDAAGAAHPGPNYPDTPFWVEGDGLPTGNVEADNMIFASGETYDLFSFAWGRDSFDGAGATMDAIFNRGDGCPNASWNGTYISFCPGLTTDDITAHEWAHAYTQYTNDLIYQWQSGALNESYSDIWGEVVDFINGRDDIPDPVNARTDGNCSTFGAGAPSVDASVRWLTGEDATGGAIRDMWTPTCYGDPGKVTDTQYFCSPADQGGVHSNSGVPNHGFALMVDGGSYNGHVGAGLGLTKAAHIHWGAQNLLTVSSNFADHADALDTACSALVGDNLADLTDGTPTGEMITVANCDEVASISDAVEYRTPPDQCGFTPMLDPDAPALCEGLGAVETIAFESFESGSLPAGWSTSSHDVANPGTFDNPGWSVVGGLPSGAPSAFAAFAPDLNTGDCAADDESGAVALDSPVITIPPGKVPRLAIDHWVATEANFDGGNVKVSVNGGPWQLVPAGAYSFNPYNGSLANAPVNTNPLEGEEAFSGTDGGTVGGSWGQSQVDLIGLAVPGDDIQLRFDFGVDGCAGIVGWYVDEVRTYACADELPPVCGNSLVEAGEQCDDGNTADGDGCSSVCAVEAGWACETPPSDAIVDGSFEAGAFGGTWTESSTNFGTPICDLGSCGTGTGTGPSDGAFWAWFGGIAALEEGSVSQDVTIPATATTLTFDLEQIVCDSPDDFVEVLVDGNQEFFSDGGSGLCGSLGYTPQSVDITAYADGGVHTVEIRSEVFATNAGGSNFFVDKVSISTNLPTPSVCTLLATELACNGGPVAFETGIPAGWSVINNEPGGPQWTTIAGAGEIGNYTGGGGDAATVSSDRFGPADFDAELRSNSFSLADGLLSAQADYLVNYQNFGGLDFLNLDISTDGGATWTNLLSWNEDHGGFRSPPGEAVSVDLSPYVQASAVQLRWHYFDPNLGDWDWYAQVDDVALACRSACDMDGDGDIGRDDYRTLGRLRGQPVPAGAPGDPDGDGVVTTSDLSFCGRRVR